MAGPPAKPAPKGRHVAARRAPRCGKTGSFRSRDNPMTAAIQAGRREERGQGRVRHLRLPVPRLLAAAALFLGGRVDPHRDQHDLKRGGAGGPPCRMDERRSGSPGTLPGGGESRTGPNSKRVTHRGGSRRSPTGKCPRNPPLERAARLPSRTRMLDIIKPVRRDHMLARRLTTRNIGPHSRRPKVR